MARLLFLTSSFPASPEDGVCGYVFDLARRLVEDFGHDARVLAPGPVRPEDERFAPVRVERFLHPWPRQRQLTAESDAGAAIAAGARLEALALSATLVLRADAAARTADVVVSHWLVPAGAAGAIARRAGLAHIAIAHGGDVHLLGRMAGGARLARFIAARSDRLVFVSADLRNRFAALVGPKAPYASEVIPMGAELGPPADVAEVARRRAGAAGHVRALFLGRLHPIKGADVLLDAAAHAAVDITIAGDGPELAALRDRAAAARLPVSFPGRVDRRERRVLLDACDVVVVPSRVDGSGREEGSPVVCAEALAAGKPVVASRSGGIEDVVRDGDNGLLVSPGDAGALASALERFACDRELRARLAAGAESSGRALTMRATAEAFDRIIGEIGAGK